VVRQGKRGSTLKYKNHPAVEASHEAITATEITTGETNEAHRLLPLVDRQSRETGQAAEVFVADTKYGTAENYLACHDRVCGPISRTLSRARTTRGDAKGSSHWWPSGMTRRLTATDARRGRNSNLDGIASSGSPWIIYVHGESARPAR
jgi:hypothetical protein